MYFSKIGHSKFDKYGMEGAYFDGVNLQFVCTKARSADVEYDTYNNNSQAYGGNSTYNVDYSLYPDTANPITVQATEAPIYTKVITHEVGDSQQDAQLSRVIVQAIPLRTDGFDYANYDYNVTGNQFPKLNVILRNQAFNMFTPPLPNQLQTNRDLVALNMAPKTAVAGRNPWRSILQTPTDLQQYTPGVNENASYVTTVGDKPNYHESFQLVAPLNSKFRRLKMKYTDKYTLVLRGISIEFNQLNRRFG